MDSSSAAATVASADEEKEKGELENGVNLIAKKRDFENGVIGDLGFSPPSPPVKKPKTCEMQRVAEIVLVLSAMAGMRGGKSPTKAELELMEEARVKLAEICNDIKPKDLIVGGGSNKDSIGNLIEDLGLNSKLKDQKLGHFRPNTTRLSIKDKLSGAAAAKKKIEESKKFPLPSATYTSQMSQPSFGAISDIRGPSHSMRMFPSEKPSNPPLSSGGLPTSPALGHVSAAPSTSVTHHVATSELRPSTVSLGVPNSNTGRDSPVLAGTNLEKTHFKSEGGLNGTSYGRQIQANAPTNQPLMNAQPNQPWTLQSHSVSSAKATPENKILNHSAVKPEGTTHLGMSQAASQAVRDQAFRPLIPPSASANLPSMHQPVQGIKYVQPPSVFNNHNEIVKIVQKLLQPKLPEHPTWTPPSRDYMTKPLSCQMCKVAVNDVETVLLCDACEKGFHLKCLEAVNQKGIPRGAEWHCPRCLTLSSGKPLPPKYGRVMRSITPPKGPSNPAVAQPSSEKKNEIVEQKVNQERLSMNGSSGVQSPAVSGADRGTCSESASNLKTLNSMEMTGHSISSSVKDTDQGKFAGNFPNNSIKTLGAVFVSPSVDISSESSTKLTQVSETRVQDERSISESKLQSPAILSETMTDKSESSKPSNSSLDIDQRELSNTGEDPTKTSHPTKTSLENCMVEESKSTRGHSDFTSALNVKENEQDIIRANFVASSESNDEARKQAGTSSGSVHRVEWISNVLKVTDGKTYYESCSVDGVTYKVQDHALFHFSYHEKLIPSKLQAMWEDIQTGSKWLTVSPCYFPSDLPEGVGHPCAPESNEVYESNHESSIMAGLIQGPCVVLPPTKFQENRERRSQLGTEGKNESGPIFLCKWFYDESKGTFQPFFS